jgi:hypothetical protein
MVKLSWLVVASAMLISQAVAQDGTRGGNQRPPVSLSSTPTAKDQRPESIVLQAIKANPMCAPYQIRTAWQKGAVVISGRVGSNAVHDQVVRIAIDLGYPFRENLIIDTAEAVRVAALNFERAAPERRAAMSSGQPSSVPRPAPPPSLTRRGNDPVSDREPSLFIYPPGWKPPVQGQERSQAQSPVPSDSVASPERQKALIEETHRRVATSEGQARLEGESARGRASIDYAIARLRAREEQNEPGSIEVESAANKADDNKSAHAALLIVAVLGSSLAIYFLPSIVALSRGHHNAAAIVALNLFLGCTFVGWVVAICWALTQVRSHDDHHIYLHGDKYGRESELHWHG